MKRPTKKQVKEMLKNGTLIKQFEKMVYGIAHKMAEKYPNESFDELVSEGFWAIVKMAPKYNPEKATLSTWLYIAIQGNMENLCTNITTTYRHVPTDFRDPRLEIVDENTWVATFLSELNEEAKQMANIALEAPAELAGVLSDGAPVLSRESFWKYMENSTNWTTLKIIQTWKELSECLA